MFMKRILSTYILLLLLVCIVACGRKDDADFSRIDALCDSDPRLAMSMLDSIDPYSLSEGGRHRYDLLTIKSRDKAYVCHTSDSLILDVIDYYSSHGSDDLYAESLYYGGRVYSDLGDLPTALEYFQKSLDRIPDDKNHLKFKGNVLSQTGRLLDDINLGSEAIPYIKNSIECSRQLNDSINIAYDNLLLVFHYRRNSDYISARKHLMEALRYSNPLAEEDKAWIQVEYASLLSSENKIDSALLVVRSMPPLVDSVCYNYTLAVSSNIYRLAGIRDTAYLYARKLIQEKDFKYGRSGYRILFSRDIFPMIPSDTIQSLMLGYESQIDKYLNTYEAKEALIQQSKYNYALHVREKEQSERQKSLLLIFSLVLISVVSCGLLYYKYKNARTEIRLRMALQVAEMIEKKQIKSEDADSTASDDKNERREVIMPSSLPASLIPDDSLKMELLEKLSSIGEEGDTAPVVDDFLLQSKEYEILLKCINTGKDIVYDTCLWKSLEEKVNISSPDFKVRLRILSSERMTAPEFEVALLIRFGISPKNMSILLARKKSTVSDRRSSLARKIFGDNFDNRALDRLILRM